MRQIVNENELTILDVSSVVVSLNVLIIIIAKNINFQVLKVAEIVVK